MLHGIWVDVFLILVYVISAITHAGLAVAAVRLHKRRVWVVWHSVQAVLAALAVTADVLRLV